MNLSTIFVLIIIAAAVGFAVRSIIRNRKNGCGCRGCSECQADCSKSKERR